MKLVTGSLIACHRLAASVAGPGCLTGLTSVDGRYTYREVSNNVLVKPEKLGKLFIKVKGLGLIEDFSAKHISL